MNHQAFFPQPPLQASSPSWYGTSIATPQEREAVALMAAGFGMYAPQMRQFPSEALINQEYAPQMQQHLDYVGRLIPTWAGAGWNNSNNPPYMSGHDALTPPGAQAILAGCTCKGTSVGVGSPIGLGSYSNMLEPPAEQIREAIEYTLQQNKSNTSTQEWALKVNQLQAKMNAYVQEHAWAFINAERGKPWQAPPSKAAGRVWAQFIDMIAEDAILSNILSLYPQIATLRDAWYQEDATFAPKSPMSEVTSTVLGLGAILGVGWLAWSMLRRPPQAVQSLQGE